MPSRLQALSSNPSTAKKRKRKKKKRNFRGKGGKIKDLKNKWSAKKKSEKF
jgi:hypothetical protein